MRIEVGEQLAIFLRVEDVLGPFLRASQGPDSMLRHWSSPRHSGVVEGKFRLGDFLQGTDLNYTRTYALV